MPARSKKRNTKDGYFRLGDSKSDILLLPRVRLPSGHSAPSSENKEPSLFDPDRQHPKEGRNVSIDPMYLDGPAIDQICVFLWDSIRVDGFSWETEIKIRRTVS